MKILEDLGLTSHEIKIYETLLNEGSSGAGEISRKTGIHRRNVYDALERLIQKSLVGYIKENNRREYHVTSPEAIIRKLDQRKKEAEQIMPELLAKFNATQEQKETLFYRGEAGLRLVLYDQINVGKEILVQATTSSVGEILKHYWPKYQLLRKEKNIPTRMLFDKSFDTPKNRAKLKDLPLCKFKFLKEYNKSPMSQYIYGDSVAIIVWSQDPIAILIRQKEIAEGFRSSFEKLWSSNL